MRLENIEVTFKMPLERMNTGGLVYSLKAIEQACDGEHNYPINFMTDEGFIPIGTANSVKYDDKEECIVVKGYINYGGTNETIYNDNGLVREMDIMAIGIGLYRGRKMKTLKAMVDEQEFELLGVFPFVSPLIPNTKLYNLFHDLNVEVGDLLVICSDQEQMIATVSEIEYGDGTIWYKIIN